MELSGGGVVKKSILFGILCWFAVTMAACANENGYEQEGITPAGQEQQTKDPIPTETEGKIIQSRPVNENGSEQNKGEKLENLTMVGRDDEYYCNLEDNLTRVFLREPADYPVLVCKDPVYDITYFINYGRDYYIYAKRGGVTELAVRIPARDLYCRQGVLYFRAESYDGYYSFDSFENGAILAYHPEDGSIEVIINENTYNLAVYPDGIIYSKQKFKVLEDGTVSDKSFQLINSYYSFETGEIRELGASKHTMARWKDRQLVMEFLQEDDTIKTVYHMETPAGETVGSLPNLSEILKKHPRKHETVDYLEVYRILGDCIYYTDTEKEEFMCYDMVTGEETTVVALALEATVTSCSFISYNGKIYFSNGLCYSIATKDQYQISFPKSVNVYAANFYTDGTDMYILSNGVLWRYEEKETGETKIQRSGVSGRCYYVGCYEGYLYPVVE